MKKIIALLIVANTACQNDNKLNLKANLNEDKRSALSIHSNNKSVIEKELIAQSVIDSVENRIYNLKKIQALNRSCKISILTQVPSDLDRNYTFKVGFNRSDRFETRYNFTFNKSQSIVFYYNTLNDKLIEMGKWDAE